jgi:hypothetical protein
MSLRPIHPGNAGWDELLALRDRQRAERSNGLQVIRLDDLPQEVNRQALMR